MLCSLVIGDWRRGNHCTLFLPARWLREGTKVRSRLLGNPRIGQQPLLKLSGVLMLMLLTFCSGCTSLRQWWRQGLKVGPEYRRPCAPVAADWIDADNPRTSSFVDPAWDWWRVFNDPVLENMVLTASQQNLPLQVAGLRVIEARAQRRIAAANLFPQSQTAFGNYARQQFSHNAVFPPSAMAQSFDNWGTGFDLSWELDVWGRIRRAIETQDAELCASIENYDDVLVTLIGDVAATYIELRSFDERIELARQNVEIQKKSLGVAEARFRSGRASQLDVDQARSNLASTEAMIPLMKQGRRLAQNRLAILLGMTPSDVAPLLVESRPIPSTPQEVAVGIPAELLRRRPDIRRAEREVAAQCARIGVATADLYPQFGINGEIRVQSEDFGDLFSGSSTAGLVVPGFRWKILNYGRITNNIRIQETRFQQQIANYENTVLVAQREVEDAIVQFLRSQERTAKLKESVDAAQRSVNTASILFGKGKIDYDRVFILEVSLVRLQDERVRAQADVATGLVRVYKSLGGGWQIRLNAPRRPSAADTSVPEMEILPPTEGIVAPLE